jgi:hypothetical protein
MSASRRSRRTEGRPISFREQLRWVAKTATYPTMGRVERRWGQVLREPADLREFLTEARAEGTLVPLADVAKVQGGVVTRANAYFLVRELAFEEIPTRFGITRGDLARVAVVMDGLETLHRIERPYIRPIVKGPEALLGPTEIAVSDKRLFDVQSLSKEQLRKKRANGALAYLRRGETVPYNVSEDRLKGGIPAQRSNIRVRRPYWYSLYAPSSSVARIAIPEHFDSRYLATLLPKGEPAVVMDKLFTAIPNDPQAAESLLWSLNSLLTWYQLELRGRTQLGQGVLEVKKADWAGVLVHNPATIAKQDALELADLFKPIRNQRTSPADEDIIRLERVRFDIAYLRVLGGSFPETLRARVEEEFRAARSERRERARSVIGQRTTPARRLTANVDAYAAKIAAGLDPFPDPRNYAPAMREGELQGSLIAISGPIDGPITLGEDLFTQGQVLVGDRVVASAGDLQVAQYVRGALLHDPDLPAVQVPPEAPLRTT